MPIISDIIRNLQLAIDSLWYNLLMMLATAHWGVMRGFFMMGHTIELLNNWLVAQAFIPLIRQTGDSLHMATGWAFIIALLVLGVTYMLASIVRLDVVSPRSAILWYVAGAIFFQIGPALYQGMNDLRRTASTAFYLSTLDAIRGEASGALASLNAVQTGDLGILTPCDNFGSYLGRPGGHGAPIIINGLDVALAYLRADGIDVMGYPYPTSDNCQGHAPPQSFPIPWEWYRPGSFFENTLSPPFFPDLTDEQRAASIGMAGAAQWRLALAWPLVWFGILEQIVGLCLTIAQGLTFIAFACAILFAFFKRTEGIAWAVIDQWLELIVQTVIIALIQALVVSFFLAGAATRNGLVVLGMSLICLVFMLVLTLSGLKAIWRSFNRLFDAFGRATGGSIIGVGAAAGAAVSAGAAVATGGLSLAGNLLGGASALANGASWSQAAGIALGGSQPLTGAARTLSYLPGLRGTELAEAADHFVEGAVTRRVARNVPVAGRVIGPLAGAALLTDRNPDNAYQDDAGRLRQPMLVPAVGRSLEAVTRGPGWRRKHEAPDSEELEGEFTPIRPRRMGRFTPVGPGPSGEGASVPSEPPASAAHIETTSQRSDYIQQETGEEMEQHISDVARGAGTSGAGGGESRLEAAGSRLERAADSLERAARGMPVEGRMSVTGAANVASVMGDVIALIGPARGADNFTVAHGMASALGVTPVENGRPPIESDLARFGLFTNQALGMGLNPQQAERVVREVKESPEGRLTPESRDELIREAQQTRGLSWDAAARDVDRLEHTARVLPNDILAYGLVNLPVAAPDAPGTPDIQTDVRVRVSLEGSATTKGQSALTDSAEALDGAEGGEG